MKGILEVRPAEGGKDSELFAKELAEALGKSAGVKVEEVGRSYRLERL